MNLTWVSTSLALWSIGVGGGIRMYSAEEEGEVKSVEKVRIFYYKYIFFSFFL